MLNDLAKYWGIKEEHKPIDTSTIDFTKGKGKIDITINYIIDIPYEAKMPLRTTHTVQRLESTIDEAKKQIKYKFDKDCHVWIQVNSRKSKPVCKDFATVDVVLRRLFKKRSLIKSLTIVRGEKGKTKETFLRIKIIEL